jgi:hypothetical protein
MNDGGMKVRFIASLMYCSQQLKVYLYINAYIPLSIQHTGGYSSVVEHPTADRAVPGSNPGAPCVKYQTLAA